jgi:hypothetical protein
MLIEKYRGEVSSDNGWSFSIIEKLESGQEIVILKHSASSKEKAIDSVVSIATSLHFS